MRAAVGMITGLLLCVCVAWGVDGQAPVTVPAIDFTDLEWYGALGTGGFGWSPGRDQSPYPDRIGRVEEPRVTGVQQLVWKHGFYDIIAAGNNPDGTVSATFAKGTLEMKQIKGRRWQIIFTPADKREPQVIFRTSRDAIGSLDRP